MLLSLAYQLSNSQNEIEGFLFPLYIFANYLGEI